MTRRLALASIAAAMIVIALCYASAFLPGGAPVWVAWPFMIATSVSLVAAMTLGAVRHGARLGPLTMPFALTLLILVAGFGLALMQPPPTAESRLWFGLPAGAALVLYGVGLLPVLVLPLAYALTFDRYTLSAEDLDRVRRQVAALRDPIPPDEDHGRNTRSVVAPRGAGAPLRGSTPNAPTTVEGV